MTKKALTPDEALVVLHRLADSAILAAAEVPKATDHVDATVRRRLAFSARSSAHAALDAYLDARGFSESERTACSALTPPTAGTTKSAPTGRAEERDDEDR